MNESVFIDDSSIVSDSSSIGVFSNIGKNCDIGDNTEIGCHVSIGDNIQIGKNCYIGDMVTICDNVKIGDDENQELESLVSSKDESYTILTLTDGSEIGIHPNEFKLFNSKSKVMQLYQDRFLSHNNQNENTKKDEDVDDFIFGL